MTKLSTSSIRATITRPEYTGENRCLPCTVLNATIAVCLAGATALLSVPAAVVVLTGAMLAIYFRGYLVPGTPALTEHFLPARLRRWFGHGGRPVTDGGELTDAEAWLIDAGVLRADGDPKLHEAFEESWNERMRALSDDSLATALAEMLDVDAKTTEISVREPVCFAHVDGTQVGQWPSRAALMADITAAAELSERVADWNHLDFEERGTLLNSLRVFQETCPRCEGHVTLVSEMVDDCCGGQQERFTMECDRCGTPML